MENPVNIDYLQRPDRPNKRITKNEDKEEDEGSNQNKNLNRDKTKLYQKKIQDIKIKHAI